MNVTATAVPSGVAPEPGSATRQMIFALRDPTRYPHAVARVELIETHISYVLLAGEFAYKIKKPVNLGFLDFSTLAARRHCCEEELRINRRSAPDVYLDVVAIAGTHAAPRIGAPGAPIEYAVRMRAFEQERLLERIARRGALVAAHADALAAEVARFHGAAACAALDSEFGGEARVLGPALQNFDQIETLAAAGAARVRLEALRAWTTREHTRLAASFARRRREGRVRECHGDLHLGNIALVGERPTLFDAIEFNPALRWIDVMSDVAFVFMDLVDHGLAALAWRFLDGWLHESGDYGGLAVMRYYLVYRAMVRAKVAVLRAAEPDAPERARAQGLAQFGDYLGLAERLARDGRGGLAITFGLSGSGKSTLAAMLVERLGAVRLRSDVERKRQAGLAAAARTGSGLGAGLYAEAMTRATYDRLLALAADALEAGYLVVVDAAFLRRADRRAFRELAARHEAPFAIASCEAPAALLRERIAARGAAGNDPSEATLEVLERQVQEAEPLEPLEREAAVFLSTASGGAPLRAACEAIARRLAADPRPHAIASEI